VWNDRRDCTAATGSHTESPGDESGAHDGKMHLTSYTDADGAGACVCACVCVCVCVCTCVFDLI